MTSKITKRQFSLKEPTFADAFFKINQLWDMTDMMQLGLPTNRDFVQIDFGQNQKSSWDTYSEDYKYTFMKLDFHLSENGTKIDRKTPSILDIFGDVGGLFELFRIVFGFVALPFSQIRLSAFLTGQLYHLSEKTDGIYDKIKNTTYIRGVTGSSNLQLKVPTSVSYM